MFGKQKRTQTFQEYISSLSNEGCLAIMNYFSKYGDPNEILNELFSVTPCCQTKKLEVRINKNFILEYNKETFLKQAQLFFYKINSLKYCYHSYCKNGNFSKVGWISTSGNELAISRLGGSESLAIYRELQQYVHGFDQLPSLDIKDEILLHSFDRLHFYFFKGDTLYARKYGEISKKITDTVNIQNIQDIIWCEQWYAWDSDASDTYALDVYLLHEKKPLTLYADSEENAFVIAMELKKRVPHLMYGPNEEYKKIFKRDPAELMDIAQNRQRL